MYHKDPQKRPPKGWKVKNILYQRMLAEAQRVGHPGLLEQVKKFEQASHDDIAVVMNTVTSAAKGEKNPDEINLSALLEKSRPNEKQAPQVEIHLHTSNQKDGRQTPEIVERQRNEEITDKDTTDKETTFDWWKDVDEYRRYTYGLEAKERKKPETVLQIAFFRWLEEQHPEIYDMSFASAGGMRTGMQTAIEMRDMRYKKGTPDVMILIPRKGYHGLILEIKTLKRYATPEQKDIIAKLNKEGYNAQIVKGWEALLIAVKTYFELTV